MDVIDKAAQLLEADQHTSCFETLVIEIERLRAALREILTYTDDDDRTDPIVMIAKRALEQS